ncbi:MAG: TldD/PmbA family protein [Verrucomicrobia bacterium]|nr:TldD/PmbA family protein [Verrucomicrobiota bacterium]
MTRAIPIWRKLLAQCVRLATGLSPDNTGNCNVVTLLTMTPLAVAPAVSIARRPGARLPWPHHRATDPNRILVMKGTGFTLAGLFLCVRLFAQHDPPAAATPDALTAVLAEELEHSMKHLAADDGLKPYYLCYAVTDVAAVTIRGSLGALRRKDASRARVLDVDLRVGDYELDNTHQIRGGTDAGRFGRFLGGSASLPIENSPMAVKHALWQSTDRIFKAAVERFQRVKTDLKTTVAEESKAHDFSRETPSRYSEPDAELSLDRKAWVERVRSVSRLALDYPLIYDSMVAVVGAAENRHVVTSEGTRLKTAAERFRVVLSASTKAEDGMDLSQSYIFNCASEAGLPSEEIVREAFQKVIEMVLALRAAPLVEPYTGPAILLNRASGVFFHEIFGHRIEGHRQKDVEEGQTFTKMVGKPILPEFLSVTDDPTQPRFGAEDLRGFYRFDDEGVPASRVDLVENGVLKTFLLSRSPVLDFTKSNGHGRREPGRQAVSRQGNLMVHSTRTVPFEKLQQMLVDECKKQNKSYGYLFEDITGGFTMTTRGGPQAFKVLPVVVYRLYADGRPKELVRGVDIVGTPLSCFSKILATGDDPAVFNGTCGAESGWVPVSAVSPSILVEQIEIEKRERSQERLPILPAPNSEKERAL